MFKAEFDDEKLLATFHRSYSTLYNKMVDKYLEKAGNKSASMRESVKQSVDEQVLRLTKDYYYKISNDVYPDYYNILGCDFIQRRLQAWAKTDAEVAAEKEDKKENRVLIFKGICIIFGFMCCVSAIVGLFSYGMDKTVAIYALGGALALWLGFKKERDKKGKKNK